MAWDGRVIQRHLCYAPIGVCVYMTLGALVTDCLPQSGDIFGLGPATTPARSAILAGPSSADGVGLELPRRMPVVFGVSISRIPTRHY